jgi:hypothetical protein
MARERSLLCQLCARRHSLERSAPREHRELERLRGDVLDEVAQHFVERAGDERLDTHRARDRPYAAPATGGPRRAYSTVRTRLFKLTAPALAHQEQD